MTPIPLAYQAAAVAHQRLINSGGYSAALPQKLIVTPDVYTEEMDATTGWVAEGAASIALNTTEKHSGTGSIKLTSDVGAAGAMHKTVDWNLASSAGFGLWVYPHSVMPDTFYGIQIYCAKEAALTNYFRLNVSVAGSGTQNAWNLIHDIPEFGGWIAGGSPSWSDINYIRIKINTNVGEVSECSFDLLEIGEVLKPAILLTFDGQYSSVYDNAYPLIKAKNMAATMYVQSLLVGDPDRMTAANLIELNANNWDIANHSATHPDFTTLTQAQIETELTTCKNYLDGLGLTRASDHVAYPGGLWDADTLAAMTATGMKTGRLANGVQWSLYDQGVYLLGYPQKINGYLPSAATTSAEVITKINAAVAMNAVCVIYLHGIVDSGPDANQWETAKLLAVLEHIESIGLQSLSTSEYERLKSAGITVYHK